MHSVQTTQLLALSNQLHDAQGTANDLRSQLLQADHSRNDAEQCANCEELELQMERMWAALSMSIWSPEYHGCRDRYHRCGHEHHVHCCITHYRGGGESTTFITPSDEEKEALHQPKYSAASIQHPTAHTPQLIVVALLILSSNLSALTTWLSLIVQQPVLPVQRVQHPPVYTMPPQMVRLELTSHHLVHKATIFPLSWLFMFLS